MQRCREVSASPKYSYNKQPPREIAWRLFCFWPREAECCAQQSYMRKHITDRFTLGHSPDPDDAFMFYAMAEHKIDLLVYQFDHRLEDYSDAK